MSADRLGLTLLILYPFLLSVSTEGRNFLSIYHRGSSGAGDAPELTRLRAGPAIHFIFLLAGIRVSLNIDKFLHVRYNIHRYNCIGQYGGQHTIRKEV